MYSLSIPRKQFKKIYGTLNVEYFSESYYDKLITVLFADKYKGEYGENIKFYNMNFDDITKLYKILDITLTLIEFENKNIVEVLEFLTIEKIEKYRILEGRGSCSLLFVEEENKDKLVKLKLSI